MTPDQTRLNEQYAKSLVEGISAAQKQMNKNMNECLFGDREIRSPTRKEKIGAFLREIKNRFSNAYDCLVKGVDPYDY